MNEAEYNDAALDARLHASAPEPVRDDGFVARTMAAVDEAARRLPAQRRAAPVAPIAIARALVAEKQRHAQQERMWRWAKAGVIVGFLLVVGVVAASPDGVAVQLPALSQWAALALLMAIGALSLAWREMRQG